MKNLSLSLKNKKQIKIKSAVALKKNPGSSQRPWRQGFTRVNLHAFAPRRRLLHRGRAARIVTEVDLRARTVENLKPTLVPGGFLGLKPDLGGVAG